MHTYFQIPCLTFFSSNRYMWLSDRSGVISLIYSKNNTGHKIDPWGNLQFMVLWKTQCPMKQRCSVCEIRIKLYLKKWCLLFCLITFYDLKSQNHFEDVSETSMYQWNDLLYSLIDKCTAVYFFEDNHVFVCELILLSPLILKATKK